MVKRKQMHAVRQNQFVDCDVNILKIIQSSNHVVKCKSSLPPADPMSSL